MRQFFGFFIPIMAGFVVLYLIVDFFDRLDILLRNDASVSASLRYFLFKIPLIITQITPAAVITAILLALGVLARHSEVTALRASGVSLMQSAVPLLGVTLVAATQRALPYRSSHSILPYPTGHWDIGLDSGGLWLLNLNKEFPCLCSAK
jgi:hypothetical protein